MMIQRLCARVRAHRASFHIAVRTLGILEGSLSCSRCAVPFRGIHTRQQDPSFKSTMAKTCCEGGRWIYLWGGAQLLPFRGMAPRRGSSHGQGQPGGVRTGKSYLHRAKKVIFILHINSSLEGICKVNLPVWKEYVK